MKTASVLVRGITNDRLSLIQNTNTATQHHTDNLYDTSVKAQCGGEGGGGPHA